MDRIDLLKIIPLALPHDYLAPLKEVTALGATPVIDLLKHAAELLDRAAWEEDTDPGAFGFIIAASHAYLEAAHLAELEMDNAEYGDEYAGPRRLWSVIQAADAAAALGGWGHLRVCAALRALEPQ